MTFSYTMILMVKLYLGGTITRRLYPEGTLDFLLEAFARSTSTKCEKWSLLPVSAVLKYVGELPDGTDPVISAQDFQQAILAGDQDGSDKMQVRYGGIMKAKE